jgi:PilZ domain
VEDQANVRMTAARAFVRSLNILLKFAKMYDFGHPRTTTQYETAWNELRTALGPKEEQASLLLAVSGEQLLLDGQPLEGGAAEKSFARVFSNAGIASLNFSPKVTKASLAKFVKAFPTGTNLKAAQVGEAFKAALQNDAHIQVNEVCFVAADSAVAKSTMAAQLAARTLGFSTERTDQLFSDPEKLLQLIMAAEGTKRSGKSGTNSGTNLGTGGGASGAPGGSGLDAPNSAALEGQNSTIQYVSQDPGLIVRNEAACTFENSGGSGGAALNGVGFANWSSGDGSDETAGGSARPLGSKERGSETLKTGSISLKSGELKGILQVLGQLGRASDAPKGKLHAHAIEKQLAELPQNAEFTASQVLATLAAHAPGEAPDSQQLLKLAEHIAVRFALESYERGDTKVNAVQQTLSDMQRELDGLRKTLGVYEEKLTEAGVELQTENEVLAHKFWSQVTDEKKKSVLESSDAWCVPAAKVREYVEVLRLSGEAGAAEKILRNYANCISSANPEQRRHAATGLVELAPVYANSSEQLFLEAIRLAGLQLAQASDPNSQSVVSAAFVRLAQEAANKREYRIVQHASEMTSFIESENPGTANNLRARIGLELRVPDFIEGALKTGDVPAELAELLRRMPLAATEHIAARFGRAALVEDSESLLWMMEVLGPEVIKHLRERLEHGEASAAIDTVGLLTRIDIETVERVLPQRMKEWKRVAHDRVVRQIAVSRAPGRGRLLLDLFPYVDPLVRPAVIDEIGMSGEKSADMSLLRLVEGHLPKNGSEYLRVKAIEALGRLGTSQAEAVLRKVAEERKTLRWAHPYEMRLAAVQAMNSINLEWVQSFIPRSELQEADLMIEPLAADPDSLTTCQRRYVRFRMDPSVPGVAIAAKKKCKIAVCNLSLSGGMGEPQQILHPGAIVELSLNTGRKAIRFQAVIRNATPRAASFEIVDIEFEERTKLRKLLLRSGKALPQYEGAPQQQADQHAAVIAG